MKRALGSVVEALAPSSWLHPWRGSGARLALRLKPFERRPRSSGARLNLARCPFARRLPPTVEPARIARKPCLRAAKRSAIAASILSNFSPVLNDALLALARNFVPSTAISARRDQPFADQRGHALRQQPVEDLRLLDPEIGEPEIFQRYVARQRPIGGVLWAAAPVAAPIPLLRSSQSHRGRRRGPERSPPASPSRERS